MTEGEERTAERIPLSWKAKLDLDEKDGRLTIWIWGFFPTFALMGSCILAGGIAAKNVAAQVAGGSFLLLGLISIAVFIRGRRSNRKEVMEENLRDWSLSKKIFSVIDYLKNNPPDLRKADFPELKEFANLRPVRVDYFPETQIRGELAGTLSGTIRGFLIYYTLRGGFSGQMRGESTPELTEQHAIMICVDEKGNSFRLIYPSNSVLKKNLARYFKRLGRKYGEGSYTEEAISQLWEECVNPILVKLNPQRIIDFLVTNLELPLEQRPNISIKGIQVKEGTIVVSLISCEEKGPETVIPIDMMERIRGLLGEKLMKALPPVLLLESDQ